PRSNSCAGSGIQSYTAGAMRRGVAREKGSMPMTLSVRGRPSITALALLVLLWGLPGRCLADVLVEDVSKERAKALGIAVRLQPSANNDVRVQVEFKTVGAMKEFRYADLELTQGGKRL